MARVATTSGDQLITLTSADHLVIEDTILTPLTVTVGRSISTVNLPAFAFTMDLSVPRSIITPIGIVNLTASMESAVGGRVISTPSLLKRADGVMVSFSVKGPGATFAGSSPSMTASVSKPNISLRGINDG